MNNFEAEEKDAQDPVQDGQNQTQLISMLRQKIKKLERIIGPTFHRSQLYPDADDDSLSSPLTNKDYVRYLSFNFITNIQHSRHI